MGSICQDLILSSLLSLSLSVSLSPTVTMLFLPRLPLLLFITFLGFCCITQVKADYLNLPCESLEHNCKQYLTPRYWCEDSSGNTCVVNCDRSTKTGEKTCYP